MPEKLLPVLAEFPPGTVQLEAGIQTFNPAVAKLISRRQDNALLERNIRRILSETGCYIHADLVAGLPGETLHSFAEGFDRLYRMGAHEIQAGILKLLSGAPIARHTEKYGMKYSPLPPYEIRENSAVSFADMRRTRRFSRYWDIIANSGTFRGAARIICGGQGNAESPFWRFMRFADALYAATHQTHSISRARLRNFIFEWLVNEEKMPEAAAKRIMEQDAVNARRAEKHHSRQARKT